VYLHACYERLLGTLAFLLLINGIDDLIPTLTCWVNWLVTRGRKPDTVPAGEGRLIAIFVPCWRESEVIGHMVRHNISAIRYPHFDFFLGVYPNDQPTIEMAQALASQIRNVHVAMCPNNGPTSKADCLNAVYGRMVDYEQQNRLHFDTVVVHDAEDLIHPDALDLIDRERTRVDMVQVPVLPLPTPVAEFTHGVYCDDFAEYQIIDMRARHLMGSFIPSNGVGTGYARKVLDRMAAANRGIVFEPTSLTEDYESGLRIFELGFTQKFCPLSRVGKDYVSTREYFPRRFQAAVRQRTRWLMGNALQSWERHGWRGPLAVKYWFWRDRKGLIVNPIGLATSFLFIAGMITACWSAATHTSWLFEVSAPWVVKLCTATLGIQTLRLLVRIQCVRRAFNLRLALLVPIRLFHGNLINAVSTWRAIERYVWARRHGRPLAWLKTEHAYPDRHSRSAQRRPLEEVLVTSGLLSKVKLDALKRKLDGEAELTDYLVHSGTLTEMELSEALGLHEGVSSIYLDPAEIRTEVAFTIPLHAQNVAQVIPFRVDRGRLLLAGPLPLESAVIESLGRYTTLQLEFHLVTWRNFQELRKVVA
jgi:adsorption protein B